MESFATPYPVFFHEDGGELGEKGFVGIHSVLTFKRFQQLMAQKTGLAANQMSAVFVCRRSANDAEKKMKLPINESTNFSIIINQHPPNRERDAHFLISVRKSKKDRKGGASGNKKKLGDDADDDDDSADPPSPPEGNIPRPTSGTAVQPLAATPAASVVAAQREAALREKERLLGKVPGTEAKASEARPASGKPPTPVLPTPSAAAAPPPSPTRALGGGAAPSAQQLPIPVANGTAASRVAAQPQQQPAAAAAAPRTVPQPIVSPKPLPGAIVPPRPAGAVSAAAAAPRAVSGGAGSSQGHVRGLSSTMGSGESMNSFAGQDGKCKFCLFCRERQHDPPFHWCLDDKIVATTKAQVPHGPISKPSGGGAMAVRAVAVA